MHSMSNSNCIKQICVGFFSLVTGCASSMIPNTEISDTSEHRNIVSFCERYRRAVEERDVDALLAMTSPRYFETGGNANATDDIDFNGFRKALLEKFRNTKSIRYEMRYHRITEDEKDIINIDYTYSASYLIPTHEKDEWHRAVRDNRLRLIRQGDSFKIIGGM